MKVADLVDELVRDDPTLVGQNRRVLLLSRPGDSRTVVLDEVIQNTKQIAGRPVAWALRPTAVPLVALAKGPSTTDELDAGIASLHARGTIT